MLAVFVERCRSWSHRSSCEYRVKKSIPLSTDYGVDPLCTCGKGKVELDKAKDSTGIFKLKDYAYRAAISPCYGLPFVEQLHDSTQFTDVKSNPSQSGEALCNTCSKERTASGEELLKCAGCGKVRYCSKECQRADWKSHKGLCKSQS